MNFVSVGDLSRSFSMRQAHAKLRDQVQTLSKEVTTGIKDDIAAHLDGDLVEFARVERGLSEAKAYGRVSREISAAAESMQAALGSLQELADEFGSQMLSDTVNATEPTMKSLARIASEQLDTAISMLNVNVGGRFLFSGARVNKEPIIPADELFGQALAVVAGAADADEAIARLTAWFDAPSGAGGFTDTAYRGATQGSGPVRIDPQTSVELEQTAADSGNRNILMGLVIGRLVAEGLFDGVSAQQTKLMRTGGGLLVAGNAELSQTRADLGATQQSIERSTARMNSLTTALSTRRTNMIEADSYQAGSQLVQAEAQLEMLFAMTARLSKLSLARYL